MSETVARVETSWNNLLAVVESIPEERLGEPGVVGEWSVKDILGHVSYWAARVPDILARQTRGDAADSDDGAYDFEPINRREAAARASWTIAQVREEMTATHARVVAALRAHPDADPDMIAGNTYDHYDEHAAEIRVWWGEG